jgi:hypothetical protein
VEHLINRNTKLLEIRILINEEYVDKSQALMNIPGKDVFMKQQLIFRPITRIVASIAMMKRMFAFLGSQQNQNVLATVSWNW